MHDFICVSCRSKLLGAECCGISYKIEDTKISYDFERILRTRFRSQYLLNKVLNNNGHLSYLYLPEGSLSLEEREDVKAFSAYIAQSFKGGNLLDVGCGTMAEPGYLKDVSRIDSCRLYGLDPIEDISFKGMKITGCAEYIPFQDHFFQTVVFATSIDHVCDLQQSLDESFRLLEHRGSLVLWHSYPPNFSFIKEMARRALRSWRHKYNAFRYFVYEEENVVFHIPNGAIDPFHKEYIPVKKLCHLARKAGFTVSDITSHGKNSYFITQEKP